MLDVVKTGVGFSDVTLRLWQLLLAALMLATAVQFSYQATVPQQDVALTLLLTLPPFRAGMRE